jgi:ElaB/YqjD/DUF883 family membrane-anchored ribosome-binding protein
MNGWYYDEQLKDPFTSISLHPNKVLNYKNEWIDVKKAGNGEDDGDGDVYKRDTVPVGGGYRNKPIARAILTDDFNVSIANNWSNVNGDDMISGLWSGLRVLAPYSPILEVGLTGIIGATSEESTQNYEDITRRFASGINKVASRAKELKSIVDPHLNEQLIVQGTRFAYYAGSGTAFGNLGMKFTIFPEFTNDGKFESVVDQAKTLLDYSNGKYREDDLSLIKAIIRMYINTTKDTAKEITDFMTEHSKKFDDWANELSKDRNSNKIQETVRTVSNKITDLLDLTGDVATSVADDISTLLTERGLIGWQSAPGGYVPSYRDIDEAIEGTLKLRVGTQYSISSLLCQDITLIFSKVMVKDPFTGGISPLYCDVNLTLTPASKFANKRLAEFIGAKDSNGKSLSRNSEREKAIMNLNNKLTSKKERLRTNYSL